MNVIVAKADNYHLSMRPKYPLVGRPTPATQRDVHRLALKEQYLPEANQKEPEDDPNRSRDEHEEAAWIEFAA